MKRCPKWLVDEAAKSYWADHAKHLEEAGVLDEHNADLFGILCEVWGELRSVDKSDSKGRIYWLGLLKQFRSLTREFKLPEKQLDILDIISKGMAG